MELISEQLLAQLPLEVERLKDAIAQADQERTLICTHALRGLLDTVGAAPATELLDRIEREARVLDQAVLESLLASLDEELADFIEALGNTQP